MRLAISGSLRARSTNTELLRVVALVAGDETEVVHYRGLGELPHFSPDLDAEGVALPTGVQELRAAVAAADGVIVSTPEYSHGVPGSLKNAFDWLVSDREPYGKPVGLLNASPHATFAHPALAETLCTMSMALVPGAMMDLPLRGRRLSAGEVASDPALA